MSILKEKCTEEIEDPNVRTTYQYVLDLKDRLQTMAELAKENLVKSTSRYKKYYDRKARNRSLQVGDKALILMPTDNNKLLLQWKGPFEVVKKVNRLYYQLNIQGKVKTFHINLLKKYVERSQYETVDVVREESVFGIVKAIVVDCVADTTQDGQLEDYPELDSCGCAEMDVNSALSTEERKRLMGMVSKYGDDLQDKPGVTNVLEHDIRMVSEKPIYVKNRSIPFSLENTVNTEVNDMLNLKIIEPSESPFCSPIVIVPKKDGTNRFCIEFRLLNRQTIFDSEPIPDADEMHAKLAGHKYTP